MRTIRLAAAIRPSCCPGQRWRPLGLGVILLWMVTGTTIANGQSGNYGLTEKPADPGLELLQQESHDLIYFNEEAGGGWVKALLLDLPNRRLPSEPTGSLSFQIIGLEGKEFVANWDDIARVDLWEVRLEREAREQIKQGNFVAAYPYLSVLLRDYPQRSGLRDLRSEFLWNDAVARARTGQLSQTLAMLEELRRFAPDYRAAAVIGAIDRVNDRLMAELVDTGELDLAQQLFARLEREYKNNRLDSITKWNAEFLKMAQAKQDQASAALEAKDYRAARRLARESIYLKPSIEGGQALLRKIDSVYPLVRVGVLQMATELEPTRLDNWGARRSGRLIYRTLFEMEGAGQEGGEYDFIFGDVESSPDRMQFELNLQTDRLPDPLNKVRGQTLADMIADRARETSPNYFAPWASAVETVGMNGPKQVKFNLRRPNVLPVSLLQVPVDGSWFGGEAGSPTGQYRRDSIEEDLVRYVLSSEPSTPTQPREIVEVRCQSGADGVNLLLQGEIDVLDQLFPADAIRLRKNNSIRVSDYPLPTIHMLIPCSEHPYVSQRTFRRALVYGTNREDILRGELLEGLNTQGCRVLSGPFPAGIQPNDPLGYAYDQSLTPRPYEPPLARLLIAMSANQMKGVAQRNKEAVPEMTPIRIALPPDNMSRVACEAIKSQWELLGLQVRLVELPIGSTLPAPDEDIADLVYASVAVWEPVIDARRLLGPEGIAASSDQLVGLGLRRIEEARNWRDVHKALVNLHAIAHHELPVIPLWQMVDSYAYRRELVGVGSEIVSLYRNAGKWRLGQ